MTGLLWIFALVLLLLTVVDPRKLWYATTAWQFKHPEANEPSEASFALGRVVSGIAALCFGVAALVSTADAVAPLTQDRLDSAGYDAAGELTGSYYTYGTPDVSDVEEALGRDDVTVTEGETVTEDAPFGESTPTTDHFELVGTEDDSLTGCLALSYDGGLFHDGDVDLDASYSSGPC